MPTSREFLSFLLEQLSALDGVSCRRMMGEYLLMYRGRVAAYVCDGRLLVRPVPSAVRLLPGAECDELPAPEPKKKKPTNISPTPEE